MSFSNGHTCQIEGITTVRIKLLDGIIRELKYVRYVPQLQKNLISVETLEAHGLRRTHGEGVAPRSRGYGDVAVTYIRRSEVPSRIYAKHQYR